MATDWWAVGTNAAGAVANFLVAGIAMWAIYRQRGDILRDRREEHAERTRAALVVAEAATYELHNMWWELEAHARSQALMKYTGPGDFELYLAKLEKREAVLNMVSDPRLPIDVLEHLFAAQRLVAKARLIFLQHTGRHDPNYGTAVVADLMDVRNSADFEHDTNNRLFLIHTGEPLFTQPKPSKPVAAAPAPAT